VLSLQQKLAETEEQVSQRMQSLRNELAEKHDTHLKTLQEELECLKANRKDEAE
jgi:hypothetical protein